MGSLAALGPFIEPVAVMLVALTALLGLPIFLANGERRRGRLRWVVGLLLLALLAHGELRSDAVVHTAILVVCGIVGGALAAWGLRTWLLRRALLAERPRSPDEPELGPRRRLWLGALRAIDPLPAAEAWPPCIYWCRQTERWDGDRWLRIATDEWAADALELCGRRQRLALDLPRSALRKGAVELQPFRPDPDGWRRDPQPQRRALYRTRIIGIADGASLRVLGRLERRAGDGLRLRDVPASAVAWGQSDASTWLGRKAWLCAAAAAASALLGVWAG